MTRSIATRISTADALPALIAYTVVLLGIPSSLIVHPLGGAGTPAQIVGMALLAWWIASRVIARREPARGNPVKWLLVCFAVALLASYVAGMSRPVAFTTELNSADRALLSLCAWAGVVLVISDGLSSWDRLERLLRIVAGGVTVVALLGMLQFFFKIDLAAVIKIPGLVANHEFGALVPRSTFERVTGTTRHPIEFGVVLACTLPLVIHFARFSATRDQQRRWWFATIVVAAGLPLSVARSAALGGLIVALYLFYTWPKRLKIQALIVTAVGVVGMSVVVPGLLGTFRSLFLNASSDPSTEGRTADYGPVLHYTLERPFFGRGIGTFIPSIYRTLDNAYLGMVAEAGLVGLITMIALMVGAMITLGRVRRHSSSPAVRNLAQSIKAGIAVLVINSATFDALGFPMCAGMIFLLVGAAGALWAIERPISAPHTAPRMTIPTGWLIAAGVILVAVIALETNMLNPKPVYQAHGAAVVTPSSGSRPTLATSGDTNMMSSVLHDIMDSRPVRDILARRGVRDYEVAMGDGSLAAGTDVGGNLSPTLHFVANASDAQSADAGLASILNQADSEMTTLQSTIGVPAGARIHLIVIQREPAFAVFGRPTRAHAVFVLLVVLIGICVLQVARLTRGTSSKPGLSGQTSAETKSELVRTSR